MIKLLNTGKLFSVLGNSDSLVPMAIKDTANSLGLTAGAYITGKETESQDRFIDEFGTQAIWLLGIPTYKKILDFALFKPFGFDADVDVRVLKDPKIFELAKDYAKKHDEKFKDNKSVKKIAKSLEDITTKQKTFKGLTFGKFVASTLLTIVSYGALTDFRQKYRENKIKKEFYERQAKEAASKKFQNSLIFTSKSFDKVHGGNYKKDKEPSFTGSFHSFVSDLMFSPVKNTMLVDGAISTERLRKSQNSQEFLTYLWKEGCFWFFIYFAGQQFKNLLEKHSLNKHNIPINLDARIVESEELKKALLDGTIMDNLHEFPVALSNKDAEVYKFVNDRQDNLIVKMAKKSEVIKTIKIKDKDGNVIDYAIDNRKYIDTQDIIGLKDKLKLFRDKGEEFVQQEAKALKKSVEQLSEGERCAALEKYLKKVINGNRWATIKNIGACIGFLGVLMPGAIVAWRKLDKDNNAYRVREDIERKLQSGMVA